MGISNAITLNLKPPKVKDSWRAMYSIHCNMYYTLYSLHYIVYVVYYYTLYTIYCITITFLGLFSFLLVNKFGPNKPLPDMLNKNCGLTQFFTPF